jgi:glycosyltransferase involved in cell wall biosynthesis
MKMNQRIFIGVTEISGFYLNLKKGLRNLGVSCDYVIFYPHPFLYDKDDEEYPFLIKAIRFLNKRRSESKLYVSKFFNRIIHDLLVVIYFFIAIFRYNIFIFGFGSSLLSGNLTLPGLRLLGKIELPILKLLRKKVIFNIGHGSEARPPYVDGAQIRWGGHDDVKKLYKLTVKMKKNVERIFKYSSVVKGAPLSTYYFSSKPFINCFALGIPYDGGKFGNNVNHDSEKLRNSKAMNKKKTPIRILHAPSDPIAKGTEKIIKAVERLKAKGYNVELVLIQGQPNEVILKELQNCDFVVDQLYCDTPMAGLATEAAFFGKPSIVGGYGIDYLRNFVPPDMWPPSKVCHPDEIEKVIEDFIMNEEERVRLGMEAQRFVREKWNLEAVARRYLQVIRGDIPSEWWVEPRAIFYLWGFGQPEEYTITLLRKLIGKFGIQSLQLNHRPDLERAYSQVIKEN